MKPIAGGRGEAGQVAARLAVAPALPRARPTTRLLEDERVLGWVLLLPTIVLLALFIAYPFVSGVWLSLTSATVGVPGIFVGLKNFAKVWNDTIFQQAAYNTFVYTGIATVGKLGLGMWLALLLNRHFKGKRLVRASMLLPFIVPTVLSTFAWKWMFDPTFSVLNWSLYHLGVIQARIGWLTDPTMALGSIIIVNVWRGMPFYAISLLAGLQTVSPELHEAAAIDGANSWQRFWRITWPLLLPVTMVVTRRPRPTFADFRRLRAHRRGPANATHVRHRTRTRSRSPRGSCEGAAASWRCSGLFVIVSSLVHPPGKAPDGRARGFRQRGMVEGRCGTWVFFLIPLTVSVVVTLFPLLDAGHGLPPGRRA
jgi:multiple sugar transport system permease protein